MTAESTITDRTSPLSAGLPPLIIGGVELDSPVILAPMSGVSDLPFRRMVKRHGVGLVVSEMIASQAMIRENIKSQKIATVAMDERPVSVQLAGCEPEVMARAAKLNEGKGAALIDINMGCPVKKIVKGDAGAALMRDERLAGQIIDAVVKAVNLPVTVKMRLGWDDESRNAPALAKIAEECGAQAITVHGRTRNQFYKGQANWQAIAGVKDAVSVPVIGNGDVNTVDDARSLIDQSGADGVMIGRGSYGRPWFPQQVAHFLATGERLADPTIAEQFETVLSHYAAMLAHYGETAGLRIARKHLSWYSRGLTGSAEFRASVNKINDRDGVVALLTAFYTPLIDQAAA